MFRWTRPGLWVGLLLATGTPAGAQSAPPPRVELGESTPNPFFPATSIPFEIHQEVCAKGHRPVVSLRIYNVLTQWVATPVLRGRGDTLNSLQLSCGKFVAYWDGRYRDGKREVTTGIYYARLIVEGERVVTRKMIARREAGQT